MRRATQANGWADAISPSRSEHVRIGHNGGPPLDLSWNAWTWRRAHAKAWSSPGREVVLLRSRRAARLGLSYRAYTSVLMDRGAHLAGLILLWEARSWLFADKIAEKLALLRDCTFIACVEGEGATPRAVLEAFGRRRDVICSYTDRTRLSDAIQAATKSNRISPSAFFAVGWNETDRALACSLGLGLYVSAVDYFEVIGPRAAQN